MELTKEDTQNLIIIINNAQIPGSAVETVAILKQKLMKFLQEPAKPKENENDKNKKPN